MTEKHFIAFAKHIKDYGSTVSPELRMAVKRDLADMVVTVHTVQDNPNFDKEKFWKACGLN